MQKSLLAIAVGQSPLEGAVIRSAIGRDPKRRSQWARVRPVVVWVRKETVVAAREAGEGAGWTRVRLGGRGRLGRPEGDV